MRSLWLVCSIAVALSGFAGGPKRPADWTVEERLAKRFDPADSAQRWQAYHTDHPGAGDGYMDHVPAGEQVTTDVVDGARNPELLLPHELFAVVVTGVTAGEPLRTRQRLLYRPAIRHFFGDDEAFWSEISDITAPIARSENASDERCRANHAALQAARSRFGSARFDEFLYEAIAPTAQRAYTGSSSFDWQGALRREAAGCRR